MIIRQADFHNQEIWNGIVDELIEKGLVEADFDVEGYNDVDVEIQITNVYLN